MGALLRSLPGASSPFGVFFKTWAAEGQKAACLFAGPEADTRGAADEGRPLLPMPLPFPAAEGHTDTKRAAGRRTSRLRARRMAQRWANRLIGWFSFCELGAPVALKAAAEVGARRLGSHQRAAAELLVDERVGWTRLPPEPVPGGSGGRLSRVQEVARRVAISGYAGATSTVDSLCASALAVQSERVALPPVAGQVRPEEHLPPPRRAEFVDLAGRELDMHASGPPCRACHRVSPSEEEKLTRRLELAGMGCYRSLEEVAEARASHGRRKPDVGASN